jgi:signal transduction histidine kinase/CheY-like chemotaxis protein
MHWLRSFLTNDPTAQDLLVPTARSQLLTVVGIYLGFHFIATLAWPETFSPSLWLVTLVLGLCAGLTGFLLERSYYLSQTVWFLGLVGATLLAYGLYANPAILLVLIFLPLMAIVSLGRVGTLLVEALVWGTVLLLNAPGGLPGLNAGYSNAVFLGSLFSGLLGWSLSSNLLSALFSASYHYTKARELLEESRHHQAMVSRVLKERNHANYQLERLNQMLDFARNRAEEARQERDRFILAVSHELRSPLNFIIGFSDLIVNSPETYADPAAWPPGLYDDIEQIYRSSTHLLGLINDILDMGQIDAQQMTIYRQQAQIEKIIQEVVEMAGPAFWHKGLALETTCEAELPAVSMDAIRIRQVLLNLVNNGLRFTEHGGVQIQATRSGEKIQVSVQDSGQGISQEDLPKVFEPFRQVGQENWRRREGSGLGLAISQRFIQLHGGEMWAESSVGQGSIFTFTLPLDQSTPEKDFGPIIESGQEWRGYARALAKQEPVVLLLSNNPLAARALQQSLETFEIIAVGNPEKMPEIVAQAFPQAIFVDKALGSKTGFRIRDLPYDLPVIDFFLPGMLDRFDSLPGNVTDYLIKPVPRERLLQAVLALENGTETLLVVDDDPAMIRFVTQVLRAAQDESARLQAITYLSAHNGQQALEQLANQAVSAMLLDLDLPDISGWEILSKMQSQPEWADIPVIILSALDFPQMFYKTGRQVFDIRLRRALTSQELSNLVAATLEHVHPKYPTTTPTPPAPPTTPAGGPVS